MSHVFEELVIEEYWNHNKQVEVKIVPVHTVKAWGSIDTAPLIYKLSTG